MARQPPAAPTRQRKRGKQGCQHRPAQPHAPAGHPPVVLDIFSKSHPFLAPRIAHAALPAALLKALHPRAFLQAEDAQVAAHKTPAEDASGQLFDCPGLQRPDMLCRQLGGLADKFDRQAALLARTPQLFTECRHSALVPHGFRVCATASCYRDARSLHTISDRPRRIKEIRACLPMRNPSRHPRRRGGMLCREVRAAGRSHSAGGSAPARLEAQRVRIPYPERIPIHRAALVAVAFFVIQRIEGTTLYFSTGCLVFLLLATFAFNAAGGLTRTSGAYIFFYSLLVVVVGIGYKAFLGEPAQIQPCVLDPRTDHRSICRRHGRDAGRRLRQPPLLAQERLAAEHPG